VAGRTVSFSDVVFEFVARPIREGDETQTALAGKMGLHQQNLSSILKGKGRYFGVDHISNYGRALGLTATELLRELAVLAHAMEMDAATGKPPPAPPGRPRKKLLVAKGKGKERLYTSEENQAAVTEEEPAPESAAVAERRPSRRGAVARRRHR
jgi:hypothetical protein